MAVSKIILNNVTKMDVTGKTVDTTNLLSGYTATKNDGTQITGQASSSALSMDTVVVTSNSTTTLVFNGDVYTSVPSFLIVMLMSDTTVGTCFYYYSASNTSPSPSDCWEVYSGTTRGITVNTSATVPTVDEWGNLFITTSSSSIFDVGTYIMYYIM